MARSDTSVVVVDGQVLFSQLLAAYLFVVLLAPFIKQVIVAIRLSIIRCGASIAVLQSPPMFAIGTAMECTGRCCGCGCSLCLARSHSPLPGARADHHGFRPCVSRLIVLVCPARGSELHRHAAFLNDGRPAIDRFAQCIERSSTPENRRWTIRP